MYKDNAKNEGINYGESSRTLLFQHIYIISQIIVNINPLYNLLTE